MKKTLYILLITLAFSYQLEAQESTEGILKGIENNNISLKAKRQLLDALKLDNKIENNLENPEIEVRHLLKNKYDATTTEYGVTQSFDFPLAYRRRSQLIGMQNKQIDLAYLNERQIVLDEARKLCINLIYYNKLDKHLTERLVRSEELYQAYTALLEKGEIDVISYNKTKINLLNARKELNLNKTDIETLTSQLVRLNGNEPLAGAPANYSSYFLPVNFDDWFQGIRSNIPLLLEAEQAIEVSKKQVQVTRSLNLPKITAGYAGEHSMKSTQHGFIVGVSVPLWGSRNTVKQKQLETNALVYEKEDKTVEIKNTLKSDYAKAKEVLKIKDEYRSIILSTNSYKLLEKSFLLGQYSLMDYLQEIGEYDEVTTSYLEIEKEYYLILSNFQKWSE